MHLAVPVGHDRPVGHRVADLVVHRLDRGVHIGRSLLEVGLLTGDRQDRAVALPLQRLDERLDPLRGVEDVGDAVVLVGLLDLPADLRDAEHDREQHRHQRDREELDRQAPVAPVSERGALSGSSGRRHEHHPGSSRTALRGRRSLSGGVGVGERRMRVIPQSSSWLGWGKVSGGGQARRLGVAPPAQNRIGPGAPPRPSVTEPIVAGCAEAGGIPDTGT